MWSLKNVTTIFLFSTSLRSWWHAHSHPLVFHTLHRGKRYTRLCPLFIYIALQCNLDSGPIFNLSLLLLGYNPVYLRLSRVWSVFLLRLRISSGCFVSTCIHSIQNITNSTNSIRNIVKSTNHRTLYISMTRKILGFAGENSYRKGCRNGRRQD